VLLVHSPCGAARLAGLSVADVLYHVVQAKRRIKELWPEIKIVCFFQKAEDNESALKKINKEDSEKLNYLSLKTEMLQELSQKDQDIDFCDCLREIKNMEVKSRLEGISQELKAAEFQKDAKKVALLVNQFHELTKKLSQD